MTCQYLNPKKSFQEKNMNEKMNEFHNYEQFTTPRPKTAIHELNASAINSSYLHDRKPVHFIFSYR